MNWQYDPQADCAYISINDVPLAYSKELDDVRILHCAADGTVRGIELIGVRDGVDVSGLPYDGEIAKLLRENNVKIVT